MTGGKSMRAMSATASSLTKISPQNRLLMWILLLLLTAAILLFPVHLVNEYSPMEAPYLFDNLPLFCSLFCLWMLLLLLLALSGQDEGGKLQWERLMLACVFGLVFLGFLVVICPNGTFSDSIYNAGHVRWILDKGSIAVGHQNLMYFDFPGMHLLVSAISGSTGIGVFGSSMLFLVFDAMLFCALLHIFLSKILKSTRLAFIGMLLAIMGSALLIEKMRIFSAGALGGTLLAGFLVMLTRSDAKLFGTRTSDRLLMLILYAAMVVSYFPTSFLAPLVLSGIYAIQVLSKNRKAWASPETIVLLFAIMVFWAIYWTSFIFANLVGFLPRMEQEVLSGDFLNAVLVRGASNVGGSLPAWASAVRLLWWALLGCGTILGLYNVFRAKRLSLAEQIATGGLLGVAVMTAVGLFGTWGGNQFARFLLYAPLFCAPILLMLLRGSGTWMRWSLALMPVMIFAVALPTFLSSVNNVKTDAIYADELAVGEFLELHATSESAVIYRLDDSSAALTDYFVPDITHHLIPQQAYYEQDDDVIWERMNALVADFKARTPWIVQQKIFLLNDKSIVPFEHLLGMTPEDPRWNGFEQSLSSTSLVYNSGHQEIYAA